MIPRPGRKTAYAKWKAADKRENAAYMDWLHSQPCATCKSWVGIESAHIGDRGIGQKSSDYFTIPLCWLCHREGPNAIHRLGRNWFGFWGLDRDDLIAKYHAMFEAQQIAAAA